MPLILHVTSPLIWQKSDVLHIYTLEPGTGSQIMLVQLNGRMPERNSLIFFSNYLFANLWRNVCSDLLPIFKLDCLFFFNCRGVRVLYVFCIQIHYVNLQVFSPILWVVFLLSWYAFETQKF